ncbi:MAG: hypothetical protein IPO81_09430 [Kouleothrix sp.]|nr:hypothetical protein [Kouleothrix sp.]
MSAMILQEIYLVIAEAGSYTTEDKDSWPVAAYADLKGARTHAARAQVVWRRLYRLVALWRRDRLHASWSPKPTTWLDTFGDPKPGSNRYDPDMRYNDTINYEVYVVPFNPNAEEEGE